MEIVLKNGGGRAGESMLLQYEIKLKASQLGSTMSASNVEIKAILQRAVKVVLLPLAFKSSCYQPTQPCRATFLSPPNTIHSAPATMSHTNRMGTDYRYLAGGSGATACHRGGGGGGHSHGEAERNNFEHDTLLYYKSVQKSLCPPLGGVSFFGLLSQSCTDCLVTE
jgi:hypothetical protein